KPLAHNAASFEPVGGHFVEFQAEHAPDARSPGIGWLRDDYIVFLRAQPQDGARVLVADIEFWILQYVTIPRAEELGSANYRLAIFGNHQLLDRVGEDGTGRNAAAHSQQENILAFWPGKYRQMTE